MVVGRGGRLAGSSSPVCTFRRLDLRVSKAAARNDAAASSAAVEDSDPEGGRASGSVCGGSVGPEIVGTAMDDIEGMGEETRGEKDEEDGGLSLSSPSGYGRQYRYDCARTTPRLDTAVFCKNQQDYIEIYTQSLVTDINIDVQDNLYLSFFKYHQIA